MNKGKTINIIAGALDITLALGLFATIGLFYAKILFFQEFYASVFFLLRDIFNLILPEFTARVLNNADIISTVILGITGLFSLIFGSVTIHKSRKSDENYIKNKASFVTFTVFELLSLLLFSSFFVNLLMNEEFFFILSLIIPIFLLTILSLRFISIGFLNAGKRKLKKENPIPV